MAASRSRPAVCRYERNSQAGNDRTATSAFWPRVVLSSRTVRTTSTGYAKGPRSLRTLLRVSRSVSLAALDANSSRASKHNGRLRRDRGPRDVH
jgi:hypothetical protein